MKYHNNPKVKILISCHKPTAYIKNDILTPIQLGCANAKLRYKDMLHDDEGDNISHLNPMYCELTAQYWAWKNLDLDYYGFCHYRRYFNFSDKEYPEDLYGNVIESFPGDFIINKYGQNEENILSNLEDYDILVTKKQNLKKAPYYNKSVLDHYYEAPFLVDEDIDRLAEIIDEKTPEYSKYAKKVFRGSEISFCNMYILKKDLFFNYCDWMFMILDEFVRRTDMSQYGTEALRTPGHLSERLFNIFVRKLMSENKKLKVRELQCVYFKETDPQLILKPAFRNNNIPIVLAANNSFAPIFSVCLQSIIDSSDKKNNYDIILLQNDLSDRNKNILQEMILGKDNFSLRFFNAEILISNYELEAKEHISSETYYRFLIQEIMPDYKKVLYIDCDTVVKKDLAVLFQTDIDDYALAAVYDPDFIGQVNGANSASLEYATDELLLKNPYEYFQAGVILFNEDMMRKMHSLDEWLRFCQYPYRYSDQDVLNKYCQNRIKFLDMSWNVLSDCNFERIEKVINYAPDKLRKDYMAARLNPNVIHFAGFMKPWYKSTEDFANEFWLIARKTPYYEQLIEILTNYETRTIINEEKERSSFKCKVKRVLKKLFNAESRKYEFLRKVYYFLKR